jgi:hypothetical protein
MKFWLIAGFFTGLVFSSMVVHRYRSRPLPVFRSPDMLYSVDDFVDRQRL